MNVEWQFGPDRDERSADAPTEAGDAAVKAGDGASEAGDVALDTLEDAAPAKRSRRLLLTVLAALVVLAGAGLVRALENYRLLERVENDVEAVYRLELEALEAGDVDLLLGFQTLRRRGDAHVDALTGPLGPLPSIELTGESEIADVRGIPGSGDGGPKESRRIEQAEVTIRRWAADGGEFLEHRLYVLDEDGAWRHERVNPPAGESLETVPGLRWIIASAVAEDLKIVVPALRAADSVLAGYCPARCPERIRLRFSGNRSGRIMRVPMREGSVLALPSPTLTFRPGDEAGERLYSRAIAELVLLRAAGKDGYLIRDHKREVTEQRAAPLIRDALRDAFLSDYGLGDERPPFHPPAADFGSIWNLWWDADRLDYYPLWVASQFTGASIGERANAARHLVDELLKERGADADALLRALEDADSPDDWLVASLGGKGALEVIAEWPSPPPPFSADRSLALMCLGEGATWLVRPGGQAINVGPACPDGFTVRDVAWRSDEQRLAIECADTQDWPSRSHIVIVDSETLRPLVSLPNLDGSIASLAWAENGRLVWNSWGRRDLSARWSWPEEGAEIGTIPTGVSFTPSLEGEQVSFTWGVDGKRLLAGDRSGHRHEVHMFDLDAPDEPVWSLIGSTADWDGRSERIAVLTPAEVGAAGGRDAVAGVEAPESGPAGSAEIAIVDAQSGAVIARRTLDAAEIAAAIAAAGLSGVRRTETGSDYVPDWHAAWLIGITAEPGLFALALPWARSGADGRSIGEAISGVVFIWPVDLDDSPTVLGFQGPFHAMWLAADHPDAPPEGDGPALYVAEMDPRDSSMRFSTIRSTGESRSLDRPVDQIDPDGLWRFRMRAGRAELRRADDESLAWWLNSPVCDSVHWAGSPQ